MADHDPRRRAHHAADRRIARAVAERGEPQDRGGDGAGGEDPPRVGTVLVGEAAQQHHGVQVDVRVEPGQRECGGDDRTRGARRHVGQGVKARQVENRL